VPTTAWSTALKDIVRPFGIVEFATTTNIGAGTSVVSTELQSRFGTDDSLNGWWVTVVIDSDGSAATNVGVTKQVTDYAASTGTLTTTGPNWGAEDETVDCFLSTVHPDDAARAFNRARQNLIPLVGIMRDVRTIVTGQHHREVLLPSTVRKISQVWIEDGRGTVQLVNSGAAFLGNNMLVNSDFETWTSTTAAENWSIGGAGASVNQERETSTVRNYGVFSGANSARVVVPDTTETTLLQAVDMTASTHTNVASEGMEVNAEAMVHTNTASRVSVRLVSADGTAHTGTGWELITGSTDLGATATSVSCGTVASSGTAMPYIVDSMTLLVGPDNPLQRNWDMAHGWEFIPAVDGESLGGRLMFKHVLPEKRRLRVLGVDILSSVSNGSGLSSTIEIDGEQLEPVLWKAREYLCQDGAMLPGFDSAISSAAYCLSLADKSLIEGKGLKLPPRAMKSVY
jgi:hypothetical protein